MKSSKEILVWPLEIINALGKLMVADDMKDFPWHPYLNGDPWDPTTGKGHIPGMIHHGMVGFFLQTFTKVAALAVTAEDIAEEAKITEPPNLFVQEMARWEKIAHPIPY